MKKYLLPFLDMLFLSRPVVLVPVWGFSIFGFLKGSLYQNEYTSPPLFFALDTDSFLWILLFSLSVAAVYVMNQIADKKVDADNEGFSLLGHGAIAQWVAPVSLFLFVILSISIPLLFNQYAILALSVLSLLLGVVYCYPPFYFTGRPITDFVTNAVGFGIVAFGAGWYMAGAALFTQDFLISALPYFFMMAAGSVSSTIPDIQGDKQHNKRTTAVVFGVENAHGVALFLLLCGLIIAILQDDVLALLCCGLSVPVYVAAVMYKHQILYESSYKVTGALCMVIAAAYSIWFFVVSIMSVLVTWLYFRLRFNINYPSLLPRDNTR